MTARKRGTCSVCKEKRLVRADGRIRHHLHPADYEPGGIFRVRCDGAGEPPAGSSS